MTKTRLKFFTLKIGSGKTPLGGSGIYSESGVMLLRSQNVHFKGLRLDDVVFVSEDIDEDMKNTRVYSGDVLLNITGASLGRCTVAPSNFPSANVNQHVSIIRCNENRLNSQYLFYNLQGAEIQNKIWGDENGSSREGLTSQQIGNFLIEIIPVENQHKVANYLDRETTEIDNLIAEKEKMLALLEEKREALISHAVTRGLDSNVAFKRSDVEWLGEVPEHWQVSKIKYLTKIVRGQFSHRPRNDPNYYDGIYPFIQTGDVANSNKFIMEYTQTLNENGYAVSKEFPSGTLVMTIAANIGDIAILNFNACFPDSIVGFIPSNKTEILFLYYLFTSMRKQFLSTAVLNTQLNLNVERVSNLFTVIPPLNEQLKIIDFLDKEIQRIYQIKTETQKSIALLKERRSALITAAVTGQISLEEMTT